MAKKLGAGDYRYESVDDWNHVPVPGVASDVATDSEDRVYVATRITQVFDDYTGTIAVFDRDGNFLRSFGGDKVRTPHQIWISPDDEIYLTDSFDHTVRKYNPAGELLQVLGRPGQPGMPGQPFNQPTCAVRSPVSGDVFVSDGYRQSRAHRFSHDGELKLSWGSGEQNLYDFEALGVEAPAGTGPGEFNCPHSITVGNNDRVYVMDRSNNRVQVFDENGVYLSQWAVEDPNKAVIDEDGVMHSAASQQVWLTTLEGKYIGSWGEHGSEPWQFKGGVHGLWIDSHGDIYVAQVDIPNIVNKYARI